MLTKKKVLIIEDDDEMRMMLSLLLKRIEVDVLTAATAEAGLEEAKRHLPDLVITDYYLPGEDCMLVLKGIADDPDMDSTRVLVLSSDDDPTKRKRCMDAGASEYLVKGNVRKITEAARKALSDGAPM